MYTDEPIVRSFNQGERLLLNVAIAAVGSDFIGSLAWYHNGTRIGSGDKYNITSDGITLSISNMTASDAGVYKVKINSVHGLQLRDTFS